MNRDYRSHTDLRALAKARESAIEAAEIRQMREAATKQEAVVAVDRRSCAGESETEDSGQAKFSRTINSYLPLTQLEQTKKLHQKEERLKNVLQDKQNEKYSIEHYRRSFL